MLNQALAIANGKGGVGKTSLTANVAAIAAQSGWEVLVVDLDPQGNLGADLGYRQMGMSDDGMALSKAVQFREPLDPPIKDVRPRLDAVPAGLATRELSQILQQRGHLESARSMDIALDSLVHQYDLILFDCPPGDDMLGHLGLAMARGLVIPIRLDAGSLDGLELMAARVADIRNLGINPDLEFLGIALFDVTLNATALRRQVEEEIVRDFKGDVRIFKRAIRHSQRAAFDTRREGMTSIEYEHEAAIDRSERLRLLHRGMDHLSKAGPPRSGAAEGLAGDYAALTNEILEAFTTPPGSRNGQASSGVVVEAQPVDPYRPAAEPSW